MACDYTMHYFLRDKAVSFAQNLSGPAILTDSSVQNGHVGIGIHSPKIANFPVSSTTIATPKTLNIFSGELLAIDMALARLTHLSVTGLSQIYKSITRFTDSQAALDALNFPTLHSGQFLV